MRLTLALGGALALVLVLTWAATGPQAEALFHWAAMQQREVQNAMAGALRAIRGGDGLALAGLCGLSAAYGFLHAFGPGHGKVLLGGAAMAGGVHFRRMAWIGLAASLGQSVTAILMVTIGAGLVAAAGGGEALAEGLLTEVSRWIVVAIGAVIAWRGARRLWRLQGADAAQAAVGPALAAQPVQAAAGYGTGFSTRRPDGLHAADPAQRTRALDMAASMGRETHAKASGDSPQHDRDATSAPHQHAGHEAHHPASHDAHHHDSLGANHHAGDDTDRHAGVGAKRDTTPHAHHHAGHDAHRHAAQHPHDHPHRHGAHDAACGCGHAHGPTVEEVAALSSWRETVALILGVAIRPCTGALFLLAISFGLKIPLAGILATLAMGLGTAGFNLLAIAGGGLFGRLLRQRTPLSVGAGPVLVGSGLQLAAGAVIVILTLGLTA